MQALVVIAHPCDDSFTHAVARSAVAGLEAAGHGVDVIDLYADDFRAEMSYEERLAYETEAPILDPQVADHASRLKRSQILVFVYPTWWSGQPAIMKGWLERVMVPGVGFAFDADGKVKPALGHIRRIVGVSTYGSPRLYVKLVNDNGRRVLNRALRMSCGWRTRTRWLPMYGMDRATDADRQAFLRKVDRDDGTAVMRALVVYCHPNPDSLIGAAKERVLAGLVAGGHEVRLTDLYADGFEPRMTAHERRTHKEPGVAPELQGYADDLQWAEALVLVYPTWFSGQPAMLKGWIDRVWVAGVAWELPEGATVVRPRLGNIRRIVVVTSHGSGKWINALEGETGKRVATRSIRALCSKRTRTTWCPIYGLDVAPESKRTAWLAKVERVVAKL